METENTPWQSYVGMNKGYNMIFDSWQEISDIIDPEANKAVNMALRILDEALDNVKATVISTKPGSAAQPELKLEVVQGDQSDSESVEEENENAGEKKDKAKEKKSFGGFKIFGGKK